MSSVDVMTGEIVPAEPMFIALPSFRIRSVGLEMVDLPTWQEWEAMGLQLQGLGRSIHWWAGDWLNIGEQEYGEAYAQAVEATGYAKQTLINDKYVCSRIPIERRRESLPFSHHQEVARFPAEIQDYWLDQAEEHGWSRDELRKAIKEANKEPTEPRRKITLSLEQVEQMLSEVEAALDKAPELAALRDMLEGLLEEE